MKEQRYQWVKKEAEELLIALGYDINKDIYEQFKERYGEKLKGTLPPIKKRRKYVKRQKN